MTRKPRLRHYLEYLTLLLFDRVLALLPFSTACALGKLLGLLSYYVVPVRRRIVRSNLHRAFPDLPRQRLRSLVRQCYVNTAITFCEFVRMRTMQPQEILNLVESIEHEEYFIEAGGAERPYVVITGHLGNWELMGACFSLKGVPITVVAKPIHNPLVDRYINGIRAAKGYEVLSTRDLATGHAGSMKRIVSRLKAGRVMVFLADQDARAHGVFVDFFGQPASTYTGPALFMTRMNLPMLPVFDVRTSTGRHKIIFEKPLYTPVERSGDPARRAERRSRPRGGDGMNKDQSQIPPAGAIQWATQQHVALLERMVRAYPEQYFWFHRRWKTQPIERSEDPAHGKDGYRGGR